MLVHSAKLLEVFLPNMHTTVSTCRIGALFLDKRALRCEWRLFCLRIRRFVVASSAGVWLLCGIVLGLIMQRVHRFIQNRALWMWIQTLLRSPLAEEINIKKFGCSDYPVFLETLLNDGDSVYSRETLLEILGTPKKTCLICTGTPVKTC